MILLNSNSSNPPPNLQPQLPLPSEAARQYEQTVLGLAYTHGKSVVSRCNLAYGRDPAQRYDVYFQDDVSGRPVLIFWHGGGWTNGYKEYVSFMAEHVVRLGMVLVAPTYRLAPAHRLPAAHADCLLLLQTLSMQAPLYGGSADRLYLSGHSAGAHLATLTALRKRELAAAGIRDGAIRACLPISGIMDLHHPSPAAQSLEERVYSMVLSAAEHDGVMSPLCWANGNTIPMLISCGENDSARVLSSNRRLASLLAYQDCRQSFHVEVGLDHFQTHLALRDPDHAWYRRLALIVKETNQ